MREPAIRNKIESVINPNQEIDFKKIYEQDMEDCVYV